MSRLERPQGNSYGMNVSKSLIPGQGYVPAVRARERAARVKKADDLIERYGLKGPLPKNLSRDERMAAYQARYNAAGGPKGEKWNRRAKIAGGVGAAGAGVSGAGALSMLAARKPRTKKIAAGAMLAGTGAWGLGNAAEYDARRRRASYRSSPAGVAGSALTRMRNYTPGE